MTPRRREQLPTTTKEATAKTTAPSKKKGFDFEFSPFGDQTFNPPGLQQQPEEQSDEELRITVSQLCQVIKDTDRVQQEVHEVAKGYALAAVGLGPAAGPTTISDITRVDINLITLNIQASIERWKDLTRCPKHRAFTIPATIYNDRNRKQTQVPRHMVVGDQGSDLYVIYPHMHKTLDLPFILAQKLGFRQMHMAVADGSTVPLTRWFIFHMNFYGIMRETWAVVCPREEGNLSILLGPPFLDDVRAIFDVHSQTIRIGNLEIEKTQLIGAPVVKSDPPKITIDVEDLLDPKDIEEAKEIVDGSDEEIWEGRRSRGRRL
ncbi:hypothetical protein AC579_1879 [Pseudocercospora musae]|uniref:Uncharacterized protein n=1 Tax=Pseudocercospora musae TaxID=113226 RepID=A0A139HZ38_9PEZI|nr:hypothetical protein AC579_1879 [Pseudocercospora musae]